MKIAKNKTAVIVLDIQNDFCDSEGAFAKYLKWNPQPIQKMVPRLAKFIDQARESGNLIIFSQMVNSATESPLNLREKLASGAERGAGKWPFGLIRGSWGWDFYLLKPHKEDIVLEKKYYDLFSNPKLKEILYKNRVERIVVTGLYTEICVFGTAQRAFTEGFQILVPSDLVASVAEREDLCKSALKIMDGYFADVVTSTKIFLE
ncbi:hypothetical protein A2116_00350 [Candidatus Jorgensenbacteria bacterium GWA1_49_17]|uniref:Isochorismatase-like domain-containing protein n=2 Tax=Candidatus Joergenseniibacteriota TaxID=1752739 RepID=A0A1F6BM65_9BACT|nr:MAG: hypothetical protein A2127_00315 [Candidatus Jorgensenbacteria bacterium GWC1_48_12]OGG40455.1 MAG: hypothetical protein A2116_00350 [Candidatus Jorgensenbacteria bacterium GWA1_49_17]